MDHWFLGRKDFVRDFCGLFRVSGKMSAESPRKKRVVAQWIDYQYRDDQISKLDFLDFLEFLEFVFSTFSKFSKDSNLLL